LNAVLWDLCMCLNYWGDEIKHNKLDGHVALCGGGEVHTEFWWETKGESALGRCGHRWKEIVKWILKKWNGGGVDLSGLE